MHKSPASSTVTWNGEESSPLRLR